MYLLKSKNEFYFSRVCFPQNLAQQGYPFDIKVPLMTKDRQVAIQRNVGISACIKEAVIASQTSQPIPYCDFKSVLDKHMQAVREQAIYIITSLSTHKLSSVEPIEFGHAVDFDDCIGSDLPEGITSEDLHNPFPYRGYLKLFIDSVRASKDCQEQEERINHFIEYTETYYIAKVTPADISHYLELLGSEGRSPKSSRDYFNSTTQFLKWLDMKGFISLNPAENIEWKLQLSLVRTNYND
ncbi:hypothetical protein ACE1OE_17240 [Vibrio sp. E150_011]